MLLVYSTWLILQHIKSQGIRLSKYFQNVEFFFRSDERSSRHERVDERGSYDGREREMRYDPRDPRYLDPRYATRDAGRYCQ